MKPDVYIMTGSARPKSGSVTHILPFGYGADEADVDKEAKVLLSRTGVAQIPAVNAGHVYGIYHQFYNHPYNIVGMEYLAKFIYPNQFKELDPAKTYSEILSRFTEVPEGKGILGAQAPAGK